MAARDSSEGGWPGLFRSAFRRSQNPMLLSDDERRIVAVNPAFARILGVRSGTLVGRRIYDLVVGGPLMSREEWRAAIRRDEVTGEADLLRADGTAMRVQYAVHPETVTGHRLVLFVAMEVPRWGSRFRRSRGASDLGSLSARERQVVELVAMGSTSKEIGDTLHIAANTVRKHVDSSMKKLDARSRAHLVAKALAEGEIRRPAQP